MSLTVLLLPCFVTFTVISRAAYRRCASTCSAPAVAGWQKAHGGILAQFFWRIHPTEQCSKIARKDNILITEQGPALVLLP
jgi:hypothetical protein